MALSNDVSVKVFPNRNPVWCWYSWVVVLKFCLDLELIRSHPVESHQDSRFFTRLRRNDSRNFIFIISNRATKTQDSSKGSRRIDSSDQNSEFIVRQRLILTFEDLIMQPFLQPPQKLLLQMPLLLLYLQLSL